MKVKVNNATADFEQSKIRAFPAHSYTKWDRERPLGQRNSPWIASRWEICFKESYYVIILVCAKKGRGSDWPTSWSAPVHSYRKYLCIQNRETLVTHFNGINPTFPKCPNFLRINCCTSIIRRGGGLLPLSTADPLPLQH